MPVAPVPPGAASPAPAPVPGPRGAFKAALAARLPARSAAAVPEPARRGLEAVQAAQARLDAVLQAARSGKTFTAGELLGLQAEAYRAVQVVDLAGKLVEQGAQSVKHALNTQL